MKIIWLSNLALLLAPLLLLQLPAASASRIDEAEWKSYIASLPLRKEALQATPKLDEVWRQFKFRHSKHYSSSLEDQFRRVIWESNYRLVHRHNQLAGQSVGRWRQLLNFTIGLNKFADMTAQEFAASRGPVWRPPAQHPRSIITSRGDPPPASVDWRLKGCVSPVRDQGALGSSAVYGVVGSAEGQLCASQGAQNTASWLLSNQQVIDCAKSVQTPGSIYAYLASNGGRLDAGTDACYPETGTRGPCAFNPNCTAAIISGVSNLPTDNEAALQSAVAFTGPVTVTVDASHPSFQLYRAGVYNEPNCSSQSLDHVMLVVGYGTAKDTGESYWLVKNSWGSQWGEAGYIRMSRNRGNQCGIASDASYAIVAPALVT